jgi:hypothetical protein
MAPQLKIIHWNARSLSLHGDNLKRLLMANNVTPDIICIQETQLGPNRSFNFDGYTCEKKDRGTSNKGGLATYVRRGLSYSVLYTKDSPEMIAIQITTREGKLNVVNIYHSPRATPESHDEYTSTFNDTRTILVGDFNAHNTLWGGQQTDPRGQLLEDLAMNSRYTILNTGVCTREEPNSLEKSAIDLAIASRHLASISRWMVFEDYCGSDHRPCITTINEEATYEDDFQPRWNYKRADWNAFKQLCREELNPTTDNDNEIQYDDFVKSLQEVAKKSIPMTTPPKRRRCLPYWTDG